MISAPAGTGKSTLTQMLIDEFPQQIVQSCSSTTRLPRPGEIDEHHYQFISKEEFENKVFNGEFLEHAKVFGNDYGTNKAEVEKLTSSGKHVILVIDIQGAKQLMETTDAIFIFIAPPNFQELKKRLIRRRTEDEETMVKRLMQAKVELDQAKNYDYQIINDKIDISYQVLRSIVIAEEHKKLKITQIGEINGN